MGKQWRTVLAGTVLLASLGACSGSADAPATSSGGAAPAPVATATQAPEPATEPSVDDRWCAAGEVVDQLEVTFGEIGAASDEWSVAMGRTWRPRR